MSGQNNDAGFEIDIPENPHDAFFGGHERADLRGQNKARHFGLGFSEIRDDPLQARRDLHAHTQVLLLSLILHGFADYGFFSEVHFLIVENQTRKIKKGVFKFSASKPNRWVLTHKANLILSAQIGKAKAPNTCVKASGNKMVGPS
jgi:hypothetical protein